MFSLFLIEAKSYSACPSGLNYQYDETFNFTVHRGQWQYFYTSHLLRHSPLVFAIKTTQPIHIAAGNTTKCPTTEDPILFKIPAGFNQFTRTGPVDLPSNGTINSIGIYAPNKDAFVVFKLEGQGKRKKWLTNSKKIFLIFLSTSTLAFIYVWYFVIPPPPVIKED